MLPYQILECTRRKKMKLLGSTKIKITTDENCENVAYLDITIEMNYLEMK